jgi:hypothetical protein
MIQARPKNNSTRGDFGGVVIRLFEDIGTEPVTQPEPVS